MDQRPATNVPAFRPILPRPSQVKEPAPAPMLRPVPAAGANPGAQQPAIQKPPTSPSNLQPPANLMAYNSYLAALGQTPVPPMLPQNVQLPTTSPGVPNTQPSMPPYTGGPLANQFRNVIDNAVRASAERVTSELMYFRSLCLRMIMKETQEKEKWKGHCVTFKQERDAARERIRQLMAERETIWRQQHPQPEAPVPQIVQGTPAQPTGSAKSTKKGTKRSREGQDGTQAPSSPSPSPISPQLKSVSPSPSPSPMVSQPAGSVFSLSPSPSPEMDKLAQNQNNLQPPPAKATKRPRRSRAQKVESAKSAEPKQAEDQLMNYVQEAPAQPLEMALDKIAEAEAPRLVIDTQIEPPFKRHRPSCSDASSETAVVSALESPKTVYQDKFEGPELEEGELLEELEEAQKRKAEDMVCDSQSIRSTPPPQVPPSPSSASSSIVAYDDESPQALYIHMDNRLLCRMCWSQQQKESGTNPSGPPASFPMSVSWETLRDHYTNVHPQQAC